jgi:hypothetical protein
VNDGATWPVGGGADYFQKFYQLQEAMHPHNFVLEAWISGGVILAFTALPIFVVPVALAYLRLLARRPVPIDVFAVALFFLILSLKSTAFTSNWLLALSLPFFVDLRQTHPIHVHADDIVAEPAPMPTSRTVDVLDPTLIED